MIGNVTSEEFSCAIRSAILENLSEGALVALEATKQTRPYQAGERLFSEGEIPESIFIICSGSVRLFMSSGDGRRLPLRSAGPGEILGLSALLSDRPYDVTAEADSGARIGVIDREQVLRFFKQNQEVGLRLLELLSRDVHSCYELVRTFGDRAPRQRV